MIDANEKDPAKVQAERDRVHRREQEIRLEAKRCRDRAERCTQQAANLDLNADKERLYLDHLDSILEGLRRAELAALRRVVRSERCPEPCGKRRYPGEEDAKRGRGRSGVRMRVYWSARCRCWHLTKDVYQAGYHKK